MQTLEKRAQVRQQLGLMDFKDHELRREGMYSCRVQELFLAF